MKTATKTASVSYGASLTFETLAEGEPAAIRVRPDERTLLRVIDGIVRLTIEGSETLLGIGDEAIVPAGASHSLASASGEARVVIGFR
jgi:mannose-6-phosphate isomerase-like protein (cupin superfamily)